MATSARRNTGPHRSPTGIKRAAARPTPVSRERVGGTARPSVNALVHELSTFVTEADLLQVLHRGLQGKFGYDAINLQILEREGWYHSLAMDAGVLQDVRRRPVRESMYARQFAHPNTTVLPIESNRRLEIGKGPGVTVRSKLAIWVPVRHQSELIGSVIYHTYRKRRVPPAELQFLEDVHARLGILLANASLNELTRNQARSLQALNGVARAMTSTLDESTVLTGLYGTLRELLPVDSLEMVTFQESTDRARHLHLDGEATATSKSLSARSPLSATARDVMAGNKPVLTHDPHPSLWVPLKEGGVARGALGIKCSRPYAYEDSTAAFLELVSDEVTLAMRNARSYEAIEDQRRRLEVVNSIGRRLASSLDRWSIMRTLREELAAFMDFDGFILATITESPEGPVAEGYQYVGGVEEVVPPVALAITGPSHEAYETGNPVLVRNSPWARSFEQSGLERERWTVGQGAAVFVSGPPEDQPHVSRSFVWVPVTSGDRITALMSLQSYRDEAFTEWHVRLLEDLAAHVNLALANAGHFAQAQTERSRLEVLHVLELGVAGASDEHQLAEAIFTAVGRYIEASNMVL